MKTFQAQIRLRKQKGKIKPRVFLFSLTYMGITGLEGLTLGIEELDSLFGGFQLGQFVVFYGSWTSHIFSELICVRSQLPPEEGGLGSTAVFVDGGNVFNPYFIAEASRQFDLNPEAVLSKIRVSRAFTSHQLTALIMEELEKVLDQHGSKLVVVSNITSLYCDPDIGRREAREIFDQVVRFLAELAKQRKIVVVATSLQPQTRRKWSLEQYLLGRSHVVAHVEATNSYVKVNLEKHPTKSVASVEVKYEVPRVEPLLEDFMEG